MALNKDVKGFALTKKFLHETVFPKYPHITSKMQSESMRLYKKTIFKPVNDERKIKIQQLNKKSVYRQIQFIDKDTNIKESQYNSKQDALGHEKNKILAEKIISQNLNDNIGEIQQQLTKVSENIKHVSNTFDQKLVDVIKEIE